MDCIACFSKFGWTYLLEDGPSLEDRVTGGRAIAGGQGHWRTSLYWSTVTGRQTLLEDRVTGGPVFAGGWLQNTDFAEGQGHWKTSLCWRTGVTGRQD